MCCNNDNCLFFLLLKTNIGSPSGLRTIEIVMESAVSGRKYFLSELQLVFTENGKCIMNENIEKKHT